MAVPRPSPPGEGETLPASWRNRASNGSGVQCANGSGKSHPGPLPILLSQNAEREKRSQRHPGSRHLPLGAADKDSVKMHRAGSFRYAALQRTVGGLQRSRSPGSLARRLGRFAGSARAGICQRHLCRHRPSALRPGGTAQTLRPRLSASGAFRPDAGGGRPAQR